MLFKYSIKYYKQINILPAKELKRRGVAAVEDLLKKGPVTVLKNNHPAFVIMSFRNYEKISGQPEQRQLSVEDLFKLPARGKRSRKDIDLQIKAERLSWDR